MFFPKTPRFGTFLVNVGLKLKIYPENDLLGPNDDNIWIPWTILTLETQHQVRAMKSRGAIQKPQI